MQGKTHWLSLLPRFNTTASELCIKRALQNSSHPQEILLFPQPVDSRNDIRLVWELMVKINNLPIWKTLSALCNVNAGLAPVGSCGLEMQKDYMKGPGQSIFSLLSWGGQSGSQKGPSSFYCVLPLFCSVVLFFFFFPRGARCLEQERLIFF